MRPREAASPAPFSSRLSRRQEERVSDERPGRAVHRHGPRRVRPVGSWQVRDVGPHARSWAGATRAGRWPRLAPRHPSPPAPLDVQDGHVHSPRPDGLGLEVTVQQPLLSWLEAPRTVTCWARGGGRRGWTTQPRVRRESHLGVTGWVLHAASGRVPRGVLGRLCVHCGHVHAHTYHLSHLRLPRSVASVTLTSGHALSERGGHTEAPRPLTRDRPCPDVLLSLNARARAAQRVTGGTFQDQVPLRISST